MKAAFLIFLAIALLVAISIYSFDAWATSFNQRMENDLSRVVAEVRSRPIDERDPPTARAIARSVSDDFVVTESKTGELLTIGFTRQPLGPFYLYDFAESDFRYEE
jgi:hypothetical protein